MKTLHWIMITAPLFLWANIGFSNTYHTVKNGETLWSISRKYNVSFNTLKQANKSRIKVSLYAGTQLVIPQSKNNDRSSYTAQNGETLWSIARKFKVSPYKLARVNHFSKNYLIKKGEKLIIPKAKAKVKQTKASLLLPGVSEEKKIKDSLYKPVSGQITEKYGLTEDKLFNAGVEISTRAKYVKSSESGEIIFVGKLRGYGETIIIEHDNKSCTIYSSKNIKAIKKIGDNIRQGEVIARGIKRKSYHLYFQVWINNRLHNPEYYLEESKERTYEFRSPNT